MKHVGYYMWRVAKFAEECQTLELMVFVFFALFSTLAFGNMPLDHYKKSFYDIRNVKFFEEKKIVFEKSKWRRIVFSREIKVKYRKVMPLYFSVKLARMQHWYKVYYNAEGKIISHAFYEDGVLKMYAQHVYSWVRGREVFARLHHIEYFDMKNYSSLGVYPMFAMDDESQN